MSDLGEWEFNIGSEELLPSVIPWWFEGDSFDEWNQWLSERRPGPPHPGDRWTIEEARDLGVVGVYRIVSKETP